MRPVKEQALNSFPESQSASNQLCNSWASSIETMRGSRSRLQFARSCRSSPSLHQRQHVHQLDQCRRFAALPRGEFAGLILPIE